MKHIIITLLLLPQVLLGQNYKKEVLNTASTFSDPHVNKWMVVQKYMDRNDTLYFTEASFKKNRFESWEDMSFLVTNPSNILIADLNESTAYILPNDQPKRSRKQNAIELDDSLTFLFEDIQEDTIFKTENGYLIHGQNKRVDLTLDSSQNLLIQFEIRTLLDNGISDSEETPISTEWRLISHSSEPETAREITRLEKYATLEKGEFVLVGQLNKFELVDLINE